MIPVLLPLPHPAKAEHEAEAATAAGAGHERNSDALSIFTLGVPSEDWNGVVLAVADGQGWSARGDLASSAAVEALEDRLTGWGDTLTFSSHGWQKPVEQALAGAFEHANARVRAQLDSPTTQPGQGVGLTAAALLGNWLCVAHVGDCRVYRLSNHELEQITADHGRLPPGRDEAKRPARALGLAEHVTPTIRFFRVKSGNVVLVCSKGLSRRLDGTDLARLMGARRSLADIARTLVTAAIQRGGDDDVSACLVRVGPLRARTLPDPFGRVGAEPGTELAGLPRYPVRAPSPWQARHIGLTLGVLALVAGLTGGWSLWHARPNVAQLAPAVDMALMDRSGSSTQDSVAAAPETTLLATPATTFVPAPTATPAATAAPPPAESATPVPEPRKEAPAVRAPAPVANDSLAILQRQLAELRERHFADSVASEARLADAQRSRDSIDGAARTAAAEKEERDRRDAQARADEETALRDAAAKAATAERVHAVRLTAGTNALNGWLSSVVSSVNTGSVSAPVFAAGPPAFAEWVGKNQPKLSEARILVASVNETAGEATAEWVAKWRTAFGTATSRRMKAIAMLVPDGDNWRLRNWRIIEGAP